ncbi:unnamed protein product [Calypogeia fissa]
MGTIAAAATVVVSQLTNARSCPRLLNHLNKKYHYFLLQRSLLFTRNPLCQNPSLSAAISVHNRVKLSRRSAFFPAGAKMVVVEKKPSSDSSSQEQQHDDFPGTELEYFQDMFALQSKATFVALVKEGDRLAVIVDRTILYPQGGGQPCDTGYISAVDERVKFRVEDVRAKNGIVYHYGNFESSEDTSFQIGQELLLKVDDSRRSQNSRLHSAGHLLDACMKTIGLVSLEPGKGHHFPDSPFVEYKGAIPVSDIEKKRAELEGEANRLVLMGGSVQAVVAPYEEAAKLCGGSLPDYIAKQSSPRVVSVGGLGCPCGGTHVSDVAEIGIIKVTQISVKKGMTKVSYTIAAATK